MANADAETQRFLSAKASPFAETAVLSLAFSPGGESLLAGNAYLFGTVFDAHRLAARGFIPHLDGAVAINAHDVIAIGNGASSGAPHEGQTLVFEDGIAAPPIALPDSGRLPAFATGAPEFLATGSFRRMVKLWRKAEGAGGYELLAETDARDQIKAISLSPDGQRIAFSRWVTDTVVACGSLPAAPAHGIDRTRRADLVDRVSPDGARSRRAAPISRSGSGPPKPAKRSACCAAART
ncbi:MAG: hypothetical protein R3F11_18255 [Verrucomicrobiales bacterium]